MCMNEYQWSCTCDGNKWSCCISYPRKPNNPDNCPGDGGI
jgi:hypothetical protein